MAKIPALASGLDTPLVEPYSQYSCRKISPKSCPATTPTFVPSTLSNCARATRIKGSCPRDLPEPNSQYTDRKKSPKASPRYHFLDSLRQSPWLVAEPLD